jgi:hypothetical protein
MRIVLLIAALALLAACGGGTPVVTAQGVLDQFRAAGLGIENIRPASDLPPVKETYREALVFTTPSLGDKGGTVFVCEKKAYCDRIFLYYDDDPGYIGHIYRLPSGTVVVQLDSGLKPDEVAKFETAVKGLP